MKTVTGIRKIFFNLRKNFGVFFHFIPYLWKKKLTFHQFIVLLRRLALFSSRIQSGKFIRIKNTTKMGLYSPGYPSKAFFISCESFLPNKPWRDGTSVVVSITSACTYTCSFCYQRSSQSRDVELSALIRTVKQIQELGVVFFTIEGGEPFLVYDRLLATIQALDDRSEIWINTTGYGVTEERLIELKEKGITGIKFSLHALDADELNRILGREYAWNHLINAISLCQKFDIPFAFNIILHPQDVSENVIQAIMEKANYWKAAYVQLLKPRKSSSWGDPNSKTYSNEDIQHLKIYVDRYNQQFRYRKYPSIFSVAIEEGLIYGCTAGGVERFYISSNGDVTPCQFFPMPFGNVMEEDFIQIYQRMRKYFLLGKSEQICDQQIYPIGILPRKETLSLSDTQQSFQMHDQIINNMSGCHSKLYEELQIIK